MLCASRVVDMNIINNECEQQSANEKKDDDEEEEENDTIIEEDWSHHLRPSSPTIKEEKKTKNQTTNDDGDVLTQKQQQQQQQQPRFSYYDTISFPLSSTSTDTDTHYSQQQQQQPLITMKLRCMDSLTPIDMINLSTGKSDETGNRIWMGSLLFIECMVRPLQQYCTSSSSLSQNPSSSSSATTMMMEETQKQLFNLRKKLFDRRQILELGTGTGASLISIGLVGMNKNNNNNNNNNSSNKNQDIRPTKMTFTDNDMNVLSLCKINCEINLRKKNSTTTTNSNSDKSINNNTDDSNDYNNNDNDYYSVCRLDWGGSRMQHQKEGELLRGSQDTIIATDVIYDLSAINILFETAYYLLKDNNNNDHHDGKCSSREDNYDDDDDDQGSIEGRYKKRDNDEGGYFVLSHVPRAAIDCEPNQIRQELEKCILKAARKYNFTPIGNSNADFNLLINENDHAIRPNTLMNIYSDSNSGRINGNNNSNHSSNGKSSSQDIISSTEYDYEELHAVGASIMIFVKN